MGIVLITKDGRRIIQPISHPATDEQVRNAIYSYLDTHGLVGALQMEALQKAVFGEDAGTIEAIDWHVGNYTSEGVETADSQAMRLISQAIVCPCPVEVRFSNTTKYYYTYLVYDSSGRLLPEESHVSGWMTDRIIRVAGDRRLALRVREKNYAVWNEERIDAFAQTVTVVPNPEIGLFKRIENVSEDVRQLPQIQQNIDSNTARITGLEQTVAGTEQNVNILLQYQDHFFTDLETGEIGYDDGADRNHSDTRYVRSRDYQYISAEDAVLIAKIPDTALWEIYRYTLENGSYVWQEVTSWHSGASAIQVQQSGYYRVLVYDESGISPGAINIILSGRKIAELLESAVESFGGTQLYDYPLSQADILEMNTTLASIRSASNANTALISFLTDLHMPCYSSPGPLAESKPRLNKQLAIYNKIAGQTDVDLCVFGGDYLNNNSTTVKGAARTTLAYLGDMIRKLDKSAPIMVARGNHDDNTMHTDYLNGYVSNEEFYEDMGNVDIVLTKRDTDYIDRCYGYYDIPNKKIRVFVLNSLDVATEVDPDYNTIQYPGQSTTGFRQEQLQFVADHLKFDEPGWQVIFFSHHAIHRQTQSYEVGTTGTSGVKSENGGDAMLEIISGFRNCLAGTAKTTKKDFEAIVDYDFRSNRSNTVIALINGHTHVYAHDYVDGVHAICVRAVEGHATYAASHGVTSSGAYFIVDRRARQLHYISCDIADEQGNQPTHHDYVYDYVVAEPGDGTVRCTSISIDGDAVTMDISSNEPVQLQVTVLPADCTQPIFWTSSNDAVSVNGDGVVVANQIGTATITARCGTETATTTITVKDMSSSAITGWSIRPKYAVNAGSASWTTYSQGTRAYAYYGSDYSSPIPIEGGKTYCITYDDISLDYPELSKIRLNVMTFAGTARLTASGNGQGLTGERTYQFTAANNADGLTFNVLIDSLSGQGDTTVSNEYKEWLDEHIHIEEVVA